MITMKTTILATAVFGLCSISSSSPVASDTQPGALSECSSWYTAVPGDGCDTIVSMFSPYVQNEGNLRLWNPPVKDCYHDVWAGYRYCVSSMTCPEPPYCESWRVLTFFHCLARSLELGQQPLPWPLQRRLPPRMITMPFSNAAPPSSTSNPPSSTGKASLFIREYFK